MDEKALCLRDSQAAIDRIWNETETPSLEALRSTIMGIEGNAGRIYWEAIRHILPIDYSWTGRIGRGATDPINSLLNYGYGILYSKIEQAVILAGLDPYAGFLHTDRSGKPSLVLDMIEEFRQFAIDRLVVGLAARNFVVEQSPDGRLYDATRTIFAQKVLEHLDSTTRYNGNRHPIRFIIQNQARMLTAYLRGKTDTYEPFRATW